MKDNVRCLNSEKIEMNCNALNKKDFKFSTHLQVWEFLYGIWQKFVKNLLADPNELQVFQKVDRHGNIYWNAYDPATGKSFSSGSEADVCLWIEQLYRY
ncbi:hypothetical protein [Dendronalium sp. ChiSLP03b]|uniref:hypothetical protein n=1 Tax=Dendronalium sp. ChiSLP03b TaxID=3075381 RepID=UPI002AD423C4|nr:hypothetical protein [Dendronalium sp. ChiSLP03b]MDZ8203237.1 hypothetical protein [Dendronalium sp. ChiSLP03b]